MSEQGGAGRYTRSFNGLIGAMAFMVVLVVGAFVLRDLVFGTPEERRPVAVEYLDDIQGLQQAGFDPVYPETLPDGWIVSEVSAELGDVATFRINLYTPGNDFVGIRQEPSDLEDLLVSYIDEDTVSEDALVEVNDVDATWEGWSDAGGDLAYSATVGGDTVLVFGNVSAAELRSIVEVLGTTEIATG